MGSIAPNNIQAVIKNSLIFAGRSKDDFPEYKSKTPICFPLYSKAAFAFFKT